MVITELYGRVGNAMFMIAIGLYISKKLKVPLAVKPRLAMKGKDREDYYPKEIFPYEFFRNFKQLKMDYDVSKFKGVGNVKKYNSYKDFAIQDNIIIRDWFISQHYVNYEAIKDVYVPSKELKEEIFDLYSPTRNTLSMNVRRGDFLNPYHVNLGWHSDPKEYWENVYKALNKTYDKILVTSDDTEWCKENLDFTDNIIIVDKQTENSKIFFDLFLPTFCGDNAISASTFSWWGSYLNRNPEKTVIMPYPWKTNDPIGSGNRFYYKGVKKFDINSYQLIN